MKRISYLFPDGRRKALTMSYDDGVVEDRKLVEIFNRSGIRGTFHLNSGAFGWPSHVPAEEVKTLYAGHEVACHSVSHPFLDHCPAPVILREMLDDRVNLETLVEYPVRGSSYPMGTYHPEAEKLLAAAGIAYARTVKSTGKFNLPDDWLAWHPSCHHSEDLLNRAAAFRQDRYSFRLLYVWGHAYEFARNNNWELIEQFCAEMAGLPEIWYATNIEIHDYVEALKRLQFSAACDRVCNPTALPLWLSVDDAPTAIAPGALQLL